MGLPQIERCCYFFDLKTGNVILGCLNALMSFGLTVKFIVVAATLGSVESDENLPPELKAELAGVYALTIILLLLFLVKFIFDLFFVYGVVVERAGIIKAYLIMWIVFIVLSMIAFFYNITHYDGLHIATQLFYLGVNFYAILLYNSFYNLLNNRELV